MIQNPEQQNLFACMLLYVWRMAEAAEQQAGED